MLPSLQPVFVVDFGAPVAELDPLLLFNVSGTNRWATQPSPPNRGAAVVKLRSLCRPAPPCMADAVIGTQIACLAWPRSPHKGAGAPVAV